MATTLDDDSVRHATGPPRWGGGKLGGWTARPCWRRESVLQSVPRGELARGDKSWLMSREANGWPFPVGSIGRSTARKSLTGPPSVVDRSAVKRDRDV